MDTAFIFNEDDRVRSKLFKILTLNEFKKLFPFTKFDMVYLKEHTNKLPKMPVYQITSMRWDHHMDEVEYELREWDNGYKGICKYRSADELTKNNPEDVAIAISEAIEEQAEKRQKLIAEEYERERAEYERLKKKYEEA